MTDFDRLPQNHSFRFLQRLESAIAASGVSEEVFCRAHFRNANFLAGARKGVRFHTKTLQRVEEMCARFLDRRTNNAHTEPQPEERSASNVAPPASEMQNSGQSDTPVGVLCLALGDRTGVAVGSIGHVATGIWDLRPRRIEADGEHLARLSRRLDTIHAAYPLSCVAFEHCHRPTQRIRMRTVNALRAQLSEWCAKRGVPLEAVDRSIVRKTWTKFGNASLDLTLEEAQRRGFGISEGNEAAALALLDYQLAQPLPRRAT